MFRKQIPWATVQIATRIHQDPMGIYQKILAGKITFPKIFHKEAGGDLWPAGCYRKVTSFKRMENDLDVSQKR